MPPIPLTNACPAPSAEASAHSAQLLDLIQAEIAANDGLLAFDRFMELALYAPGLGYYVSGNQVLGTGGDFVTAPEISPLFGQCLANQCAEVLERLGGGDILEFGPGSGALAAQVLQRLAALERLPGRYLLLEPSPTLQHRQRAMLAHQAPELAAHCTWLTALPKKFRGVVVANEVLDAMPVHRFAIAADGSPQEIFVQSRDGTLSEIQATPRSSGLSDAIAAIRHHTALAPGMVSEINLRLPPWFAALDECLDAGLVLLIDYGYRRENYYQADRRAGTLMCHYRHLAHENPFFHPGLQDITAHVDFTAVARAAETAGLTLHGFATQAHFLIGLGIDQLLADAAAHGDFDQLLAAKQLLLPAAMGERFKAIALGKHLEDGWSGFAERDLRGHLMGEPPPALATESGTSATETSKKS